MSETLGGDQIFWLRSQTVPIDATWSSPPAPQSIRMDFRDSLVVGRTGTGHRGQGDGRHGSRGFYIFKNGPLETCPPARRCPLLDP